MRRSVSAPGANSPWVDGHDHLAHLLGLVPNGVLRGNTGPRHPDVQIHNAVEGRILQTNFAGRKLSE